MSTKYLRLLLPVSVLGLCLFQLAPAQSSGSAMNFHAKLFGRNEVPAVSTTGSGEFKATVRPDGKGLDYEISYKDLSGAPSMSHIHIGQKFAAGGIMIWLCGTTQPAKPADAPTCPGGVAGTWSGTLSASQVVGSAAAQGISAGEWEEALQVIRSGNAYVNIHTAQSPSGEIRGQLKPGKGVNDDDDHNDGKGDEKSANKRGNGKGNGSGGDGE